MNLLLDENFSPRLVPRLLSLFPGLTHVREIGLRQAPDVAIWEWAKDNSYSILTTDFDFFVIVQSLGEDLLPSFFCRMQPEARRISKPEKHIPEIFASICVHLRPSLCSQSNLFYRMTNVFTPRTPLN